MFLMINRESTSGKALISVFEEIYKAQQGAGGAQPGPDGQEGHGASNDGNTETVTDAEFEEVK